MFVDKLGNLGDFRFRIILLVIHLYWFISLFPGLAQTDAETQVNLLRSGESSGQWTGSYFRLLQVLTLDGRLLWPAALFGQILISFSVYQFTKIFLKLNYRHNLVHFFFVLTPLFGFFSLTVNHEVPLISGMLLIFSLLKKRREFNFQNNILLFSSIFLLTCAYPGYIVLGILIVYLLFKKYFRMSAVLAVSGLLVGLFSFVFSSVTPIGEALRFAPLLGDIKCVVQDPKSTIMQSDWEFLESVAPRELWLNQDPCYSADFAFFALPNLNKNTGELKKVWLNIAKSNPQFVLNAHLERSRVALPPIFFKPPINMFANTDVARGFPDQVSPGILATAQSQVFEAPKNQISQFLRSVSVSSAYIVNQRTSLWGWGGLWLTFVGFLVFLGISGLTGYIVMSLVGIHVFLFVWSPQSDSRYVMSSVIIGVLSLIWLALAKMQPKKE